MTNFNLKKHFLMTPLKIDRVRCINVESLVIFSHMMGINPLKPIVESGSRLLAQISREI